MNLTKPGLTRWLARLKPSPPSASRVELAEQAASRYTGPKKEEAFPLRLNIVIQIVGSRGDIQPFIALGKSLKQYSHHVRLATHLTFRISVKESGLEYFDNGGHPAEMTTYMVKNTELLPEFKTIRSGAIKRHRRDMGDIIHGCWRSCFETGDGTQLHQIPDDFSAWCRRLSTTAICGGRNYCKSPERRSYSLCGKAWDPAYYNVYVSYAPRAVPDIVNIEHAESEYIGCHGHLPKLSRTR